MRGNINKSPKWLEMMKKNENELNECLNKRIKHPKMERSTFEVSRHHNLFSNMRKFEKYTFAILKSIFEPKKRKGRRI